MATTTCSKCGGKRFESVVVSPKGATVKVTVVQCVACGVPIGTMEFLSAASCRARVWR
jgi:hypothetical protein